MLKLLIRYSNEESINDKYYDQIYHPDRGLYLNSVLGGEESPLIYPTLIGIYINCIKYLRPYTFREIDSHSNAEDLYIYTHDDPFDDVILACNLCHQFKRVHAQNIDIPIDIPNLITFPIYVGLNIPKISKENHILICHHQSHPIRRKFVSRTYGKEEYKALLKKAKYVLIVRGNGLDTYRLWESIEENCIPIIYRDESSRNFIRYLEKYLRSRNIEYLLLEEGDGIKVFGIPILR